MSAVLPVNKRSYGQLLLNERVLKDDGSTYTIATSINRAIVDHIVYYFREYLSDVIFQMSSVSSNTSVTIYGKYPEKLTINDYPIIVIYIQSNNTNQMFLGDTIANTGISEFYARQGDYEIVADVWARNQLEQETLTGMVVRLIGDMNTDINFLKRGFQDVKYMGTLGREFDITDKIVQTVSHLDSSINIRREQVVFRTGFFYRIRMPKTLLTNNSDFIVSVNGTVYGQDSSNATTITVSISNKKKIFIQETTITSE